METPRCTTCRNPIKARHRFIEQPRTGRVFHDDCWDDAQVTLQADYLRMIAEQGLEGLLSPYVVRLDAPFVPEQRTEEYDVPEAPEVVTEPVTVPAQATGPAAVLEVEPA